MRHTTWLLLGAAMSTASATSVPPSNILPLRRRAQTSSNPAALTSSEHGIIFDVEATIGDQTFLFQVDTGSSDTWVVWAGYQCFNSSDNAQVPQEECTYSDRTYHASSTFERIPNKTMGVQYGDGIVIGSMGYETVTLAGITVDRQVIGVVDRATNPGDGINSGLIGFGYPSLTSAHAGTGVDNASLLLDRITYNPLFVNMYSQGSVEPWFSIAVDRPATSASVNAGGHLGLGELPPVPHSPTFAVAPVEITGSIPALFTNGTKMITEWTLSVDSVGWAAADGSSRGRNDTRFQAVVDSGNYLNVLPPAVVDEINAAFAPPPVLDDESGAFLVDCDAAAPTVGIAVGGQTFYLAAADMIIPLGDGTCMASLASSASEGDVVLNFLGDAFMRNVISVFDMGKNEMRFAARTDGGGSSTYNGSATATATASASASVSATATPHISSGFLLGPAGRGVQLAAVILLAVVL